MTDFMTTLFGPLSRDFCDYFFILSVFGFVLLAVLIVSSLLVGISKRKGIDFYLQHFRWVGPFSRRPDDFSK